MKYKNLKASIIVSILLGLASCNGEDDPKSETLDPSEEKVLSIDQIKNSQEEFLVQEIDNPDEKEPEVPDEPELNKDEAETANEVEAETEEDEIEDDDETEEDDIEEDATEDEVK
jgi:hypothetical protein